ncbi:MAG: Smr/MutS family protein [Proteobacteria bacterium]|nr:Smr/MutS family protein [Pseudomonadota bacterium]MCH8177252.1 Smr/MutS family protein [Pseudomonadota bacterium]
MKQKSDGKTSFADLVPGVKKLDHDRINTYRDRVKNSARSTPGSPESRPDFSNIGFRQLNRLQDSHYDSSITKKQQRKIRQGTLAVDDQLDLHGCTQEQAIIELNHFLDHALSLGFKLLIIIHGKGQRSAGDAVLKPLVQHWLAHQPSVRAWCPAQANHGGSGASYVYLRSS